MAFREVLQVSFLTRLAHAGAERRIAEKKRERLQQGLAILVGYDHAGDSLFDDLFRRPFAGDASFAGPHRFQKGHPKTFQPAARHYEKGAIGIKAAESFVINPAEKIDRIPETQLPTLFFQPLSIISITRNHEAGGGKALPNRRPKFQQ